MNSVAEPTLRLGALGLGVVGLLLCLSATQVAARLRLRLPDRLTARPSTVFVLGFLLIVLAIFSVAST